jgi:hypothetical protein
MKTLVLVLLVAAGCGESKNEKSAPGPVGEKKAPTPAGPAAKPLDQAEVNGLVNRWKDAQNQDDFAAYQALYARRMTGVKRIGARVFRFDRDGWMTDRGRMFTKTTRMKVAVDRVEISVAGASAIVHFDQSFKQGSFQDAGPKQLVIVREGDELRIAREEMLASTVVGAGAAAGGGAAADTFLVLDGEILLDETATPEVEGAPVLDPGEGSASFRARTDVKAADVPLAAKTFTVYGRGGAKCASRLDRVSLVSGLTPHFGTVAEWHGQAETPALSEAAIAKIVWDTGRSVLVGRPGQCTGLIARAGGPPIVAFDEVTDDKLAAEVLARFRKLDEWEKTQHEFAATDERGAWDREGAIVHIFRHPTTGKTWAVVHATGGDMCSGFSAEMTAVFEQDKKSWKDVSGAVLEQFEPEAAFDLDGDGKPELVAPRTLVGDTGDGFTTLRRFDYPDNDCPC